MVTCAFAGRVQDMVCFAESLPFPPSRHRRREADFQGSKWSGCLPIQVAGTFDVPPGARCLHEMTQEA